MTWGSGVHTCHSWEDSTLRSQGLLSESMLLFCSPSGSQREFWALLSGLVGEGGSHRLGDRDTQEIQDSQCTAKARTQTSSPNWLFKAQVPAVQEERPSQHSDPKMQVLVLLPG